MASPGRFHFVNPDNSSAIGHKAKATARAFVARRTRAHWSTKSNDKHDRRKLIKKFTKSKSHGETPYTCRSDRKTVSAELTSMLKKNTTKDGRILQEHSSRPQRFPRKQPGTCNSCGSSFDDFAVATAAGICPFCAKGLNPERVKLRLPILDSLLSPYGPAAVTVEPSHISLLAFFNSAISPQISSSAIRSPRHTQHYLTALLRNSACMYAFICLTALQLGILQSEKRADYLLQAMQFRLQAVTAIQDNLSDPEKAVSDENIAAVFNLLCVEENLFLPAFDDKIGDTQLRPDHAQRLAHMNGLKGLINMRGGVMSLGKSRALQMFLIRHSAVQAAVSFEPSYFLPRDTLSHIFQYPGSMLRLPNSCPMAIASTSQGINTELVEIIRSAEYLMRDTAAWFRNPDTLTGGRDLLDIQNLYSVIISRFVQWHDENSSRCTPVEGITSLCLIIFMCFVMRGRHTVYGPLPSCLLRLKPYFSSPSVLNELRQIGFDVWIGLVLVIGSAGHHDFENYFFRIYLEIIYGNQIQTFDHLMGHLETCIWISRPMSVYAREIWKETPELVKQNPKTSDRLRGRLFQAEDLNPTLMQRGASVEAKRPVSLLGFPAFKLDHTDSTLFQE